MKSDHLYAGYKDLLKDKRFLQWQLMPDESQCTYWEDFFNQHPDLEKDLQQAISFLKKEGLNKCNLNDIERTALFSKMHKSTRQINRTKQRRLLWVAFSSAAAIAIIILGVTLFYHSSKPEIIPDKEFIIGELLNSEDIQLITSEEAILFQNDVEVTLNEEGTAEIIQGNKESSKITIAKDKLNTLIIPFGKRSTLTLADGSKVWLNSGSVLEFPVQFSDIKREIQLVSGEMYIEVAHNNEKPFYVKTTNFNVKVHGTKFNISNYSGSPQSVVLVEGSVSLQSEGYSELFIAPNDKAVYTGTGTFDTQKVDTYYLTSWKDGYLSLDKTPMTEVLQHISRYYNLSFDFGQNVNLQQRSCTGKIYLSENLDNVMSTIALLSSTQYEKVNDRIYITNKLN